MTAAPVYDDNTLILQCCPVTAHHFMWVNQSVSSLIIR